jgi:agmatine/peptidylarginine deiminase
MVERHEFSPPSVERKSSISLRWLPSTGRPGKNLAQPSTSLYRLPGEFERHDALLLGCDELAVQYPDLLVNIVSAAGQNISILALVSDDDGIELVTEILKERKVSTEGIRFLHIVHDSMWIRDYGPFSVQRHDGQPEIVDAKYDREVGRANDDFVPVVVAKHLGMSVVRAPVLLEGGNLLSNGEGLCITTTALLDNNADREIDDGQVHRILHRYFGAEQAVFLEPLIGESTGHVDMFALFVSPDTVVVGSYDPLTDPVNAAVLDRNAACLAQTRTSRGPLRVVRIPMPDNTDGVWRTYTNVIFANGVLMVPVYADMETERHEVAMNVFRHILPGWKITPIDATDAIQCGGALHCVSKAILSLGGWQDRSKHHKVKKANSSLQPLATVTPFAAYRSRGLSVPQRATTNRHTDGAMTLEYAVFRELFMWPPASN